MLKDLSCWKLYGYHYRDQLKIFMILDTRGTHVLFHYHDTFVTWSYCVSRVSSIGWEQKKIVPKHQQNWCSRTQLFYRKRPTKTDVETGTNYIITNLTCLKKNIISCSIAFQQVWLVWFFLNMHQTLQSKSLIHERQSHCA